MFSRRDALRFAADASVAAPTVAAKDAAALLAAPAHGPAPLAIPPATPGTASAYEDGALYSPADYADDLARSFGNEISSGHVAPDRMAEYKQQRGAMWASLPLLNSVAHDHPWHLMDEAVLALASESYAAGVRVGAATEHLRLAVVGPRRVCARCHGLGHAGSPYHEAEAGPDAERCPVCGGAGTVSSPAPAVVAVTD